MFALGILNLFGKCKRDEEKVPVKPLFSGDLAKYLQNEQEPVKPDKDQDSDKDGVIVLLSFMTQEAQDCMGWICTECGTRNISSDYCEVCGLKYFNTP